MALKLAIKNIELDSGDLPKVDISVYISLN